MSKIRRGWTSIHHRAQVIELNIKRMMMNI